MTGGQIGLVEFSPDQEEPGEDHPYQRLDEEPAVEIGPQLAALNAALEELGARLQATASLIELLDTAKPARAAGIAVPDDAKSVAALRSVLPALGADGVEEHLDLLRTLTQLRNLVPAHPAYDERVLLFARFGVETPVSDTTAHGAWLRIAERSRQALRGLRLALQMGDPNSETG